MPVRERFDPTGYVQGTFDIEELEETKETSKTLTGTLSTILNMEPPLRCRRGTAFSVC